MFDSGNVVVGLEIGTSKVCAAVGEVNAQGAFTVLGLGQARSRGVRKGEITDIARSSEDVRTALAEAEQMADVEIRGVFLGITGAHVRGFSNRGIHPVVSADRAISDDDVQDAIRNARAVALGSDQVILHTIRQDFVVDNLEGIENPAGMVGERLEARVHVIHGHGHRVENSLRVVRGIQLEAEQVVFNGLASALAVLGREQKELGSLAIDLGAGTTEYALYAGSVLRHSGVLAVGGDHVSNDLAIGLRVPLGRAEQLKLEHGAACVDDACRGVGLTLPSESGTRERVIQLEHLRRIQCLRLEETLELVARDVGPLLEQARSGVYLSGGGSRTPGIEELAERVFQLPVSVARTQDVSGSTAALDQPEFATAIGLARFGALRQRRRPPGGLGGLLGGLWRR